MGDQEEEGGRRFCTVDGTRGCFEMTTLRLYASLLKILKESVGFDDTGLHKPYGAWPDSFSQRIDPCADPYNFYRGGLGGKLSKQRSAPLQTADFACRPVMFWAPEHQFGQDFYPDNKPFCPFHPGETTCVMHNGWSGYFRRVYDKDGVTALTGREYLCLIRREEKKPYTFYSYDSGVVAQAPPYVRSYWHNFGFRLTRKGGIRWILVD